MKLQAAPQDDWEVSDLSSHTQPNVTSSPSAASCSQPPHNPSFSLSLGMVGTKSDFVLPTLDPSR